MPPARPRRRASASAALAGVVGFAALTACSGGSTATGPSASPLPSSPVTTAGPSGPTVVSGGAGPTVTGAVPSTTATPRPSFATTTAPPTRPTVPGQVDPNVPPAPPNISIPVVEIDDDPNLAVWCPLADEIVREIDLSKNFDKERVDRMLLLMRRGQELTPAKVAESLDVMVVELDKLAASEVFLDPPDVPFDELVVPIIGEDGLARLTQGFVGTYVYYKANCKV